MIEFLKVHRYSQTLNIYSASLKGHQIPAVFNGITILKKKK